MRCGGEPRVRSHRQAEPLIKPVSTLTKLLWALTASCVVGALLVWSSSDDADQASRPRGLALQAEEPAPEAAPSTASAATGDPAEAAREAAQLAQAERREAEAVRYARQRVPIVMYSTTWCGVCRSARAYLNANNMRYTEYDVEANAAARAEHRRLNPAGGVPTFDIGGEVLVGFSDRGFERALDAAAARDER